MREKFLSEYLQNKLYKILTDMKLIIAYRIFGDFFYMNFHDFGSEENVTLNRSHKIYTQVDFNVISYHKFKD